MKRAALPERLNAVGRWEIRCRTCGVWYEECDLAAVFKHEHLLGENTSAVENVQPGSELDPRSRNH